MSVVQRRRPSSAGLMPETPPANASGEPASQEVQQRWVQRHEEITDIAARLFAKNGYSATGMNELCDAVGLGKGALYYYIGSKQQLLCSIHDRVMNNVLKSAEVVTTIPAPAGERLRLLGAELMSIITTYPDHVWVFLHEWPSLVGGEYWEDFKGKRRSYEGAIAEILSDGVRDGEFDIEDVPLAVRAWLGMHNYTYQWFRRDGGLTAIEVATRFHANFVQGIRRRL